MTETVQAAPEILSETPPTPPKRRGRPPGSKNSTTSSRRGRPRKSMADRIGGMLTMANLLFFFTPEKYRADALDIVEISAISKALDDAARENATLYKYLDAALGGTGSGFFNLSVIVACVAGRRLARHEIFVGAEWDDRLGAYIAMNAGNIPKSDEVDFGALFASVDTEAEPIA